MILTNGDSWTGGLVYGNTPSHWPSQLRLKYGVDVTNLAWSGASNSRIYRTTIEYLYSNQPKPTHLVIGWSGLDRAELPTVNRLYMRVNPIEGCDTFIENGEPVPNLVKIRDLYYRYLHSEELSYKLHIQNILALRDICEFKGIKLWMFNSYCPMPKLLAQAGATANNWILAPNATMGLTLKNLDFGVTASNHTSVEGQAHWADLVYTKLGL